jgi:hypothetical protein
MGLTNVLAARPHFISRAGRTAAANSFSAAGRDGRTTEIVEILHFAAWAADKPEGALTL